MATVREGSKGALAVVDDLNTVMTWVSCADVRNTAARAVELDFAVLPGERIVLRPLARPRAG
jgi:hypothetical protein